MCITHPLLPVSSKCLKRPKLFCLKRPVLKVKSSLNKVSDVPANSLMREENRNISGEDSRYFLVRQEEQNALFANAGALEVLSRVAD